VNEIHLKGTLLLAPACFILAMSMSIRVNSDVQKAEDIMMNMVELEQGAPCSTHV
jgi:hypothetical protein